MSTLPCIQGREMDCAALVFREAALASAKITWDLLLMAKFTALYYGVPFNLQVKLIFAAILPPGTVQC